MNYRIINCILLGVLFFNSTQAQIEIIEQDILVIQNVENWNQQFDIKIKNTTDSIVNFRWRYNMPEEIDGMISQQVYDLNRHYIDLNSTCELGMIHTNMLMPEDLEPTIILEFRVTEIVPLEFEHLIDSISLELVSNPDCDIIYNSINVSKGDVLNSDNLESFPIKIYPNPVRDILYFENLPSSVQDYKIFNIKGELLQVGQINNETVRMDFKDKGLFVLQYIFNNKVKGIRFLKE